MISKFLPINHDDCFAWQTSDRQSPIYLFISQKSVIPVNPALYFSDTLYIPINSSGSSWTMHIFVSMR